MWLVMFNLFNGSNSIPQVICTTEQQAQRIISSFSYNSVGRYSYTFVPMAETQNSVFFMQPNLY